MTPALVALTMASAPFVTILAAQAAGGIQPARRIEMRVETLAGRESGPVKSCKTVQAASAGPVLFWAAFGEATPSDGTSIKLLRAVDQCGNGNYSRPSGEASAGVTAPYLIHEISAVAGWSPGAMDPGPGDAVQISLTLTSRRLTGFSPDGKPLYGNPVTDRRNFRLEEGEEYLLPCPALDAGGLETKDVREIFLRIRTGWAGRPGATEYGTIAIMGSAPGSEVLLDGGVAGRAGPDGSLQLTSVPVGVREVRTRSLPGRIVSRHVLVAKGKTVVVSPEVFATGTPAQPAVTPAGKNAEGFPEYRRIRDEAIMVEIPEGEFLMGNLKTEGAPLPHTVYVSTFLIDKLPVTVGRYKRFAAATGRPLPPDPYWGVHDDFPVAFVRWDEGKAYCEWAGGRLPTEAEREKATRGTDGRMWPWGNEPPPAPDRAVFRRNWGTEGNDAVGIRPAGASPYGLLDTGGNMWEWCEDWWAPDYFKLSPPKDPTGPRTGRARVVKGGSWDSRPSVLSASSRNFGYVGYREGDFGFRCAADPQR